MFYQRSINTSDKKANTACYKKGVWTVQPILDGLPNTILLYIVFTTAVSKLYSLHYPVDDANVSQTSLCSVFTRGKMMMASKVYFCHIPDILQNSVMLSLILVFSSMCNLDFQNMLFFWSSFVTKVTSFMYLPINPS